jgi:hypothetical protein
LGSLEDFSIALVVLSGIRRSFAPRGGPLMKIVPGKLATIQFPSGIQLMVERSRLNQRTEINSGGKA